MALAEQLVGEARERRKRRMEVRERTVEGVSAGLFVVASVIVALSLSTPREFDLVLALGLTAAYAVFTRVRFEVGDYHVSAAQLAFVPMLVLLPLPYVPLLVALGLVASSLPELSSGTWHRDRWISLISDAWFCIPPVLLLAALSAGEPSLGSAWYYALAFGAQMAADLAWGVIRDKLLNDIPLWESVRPSLETARVDAVLSPIAFLVALAATGEVFTILALAPLVWLLEVFSHDRRQRYTATLELNRAYRGTVMLLADVVEFDDNYTADHSRSVVELVQAVADEMDISAERRQELEFAALLHDVGKISIPKEILNKPAKLSRHEFEVMKTHTIEGQFMLDRIGGLLGRVGEIVRSCHERWDGGGYPDGLAGTEIPLEARIVFSCDAYNAMTTDRPYRQALPVSQAVAELQTNAGSQFDPDVVAALYKVVADGHPAAETTDEVRSILASVNMSPALTKSPTESAPA